MSAGLADSLLIENYNHAKQEILTAIDVQYRLLSLLITATAAVFVYVLDIEKNNIRPLVFVACLIIPGLYAFFGVLWLDQVYRQMRLGAFIFKLETALIKLDDPLDIHEIGWEHFVQSEKNKVGIPKSKRFNKTSRMYYRVCLGLFFAFPIATYVFTCIFRAGNIVFIHNDLQLPALCGIALYVLFLIYAVKYILSIMGLTNCFDEDTDPTDFGEDNNNRGNLDYSAEDRHCVEENKEVCV